MKLNCTNTPGAYDEAKFALDSSVHAQTAEYARWYAGSEQHLIACDWYRTLTKFDASATSKCTTSHIPARSSLIWLSVGSSSHWPNIVTVNRIECSSLATIPNVSVAICDCWFCGRVNNERIFKVIQCCINLLH